jgi:hypothetical protein
MSRCEAKWDFQGAICTYRQSFTAEDTIAVIAAIGRLDVFPDLKFVIHDFTEISSIPLKVAIITTMGSSSLISVKFHDALKTAIVTTDPIFKKELMYLKKLSQRSIEIYSSIDDAVKWARN